MKTAEEWVYAILAVLGLVIHCWIRVAPLPWWYNLQWLEGSPSSAGQFIADAMANPAAASLTVDVGLACLCFFVWLLLESRRLGMRYTWLLVPYALGVALASAFPLFLLLRARRLRAVS